MKLVDANVLLYAVNRDAHHHDAARRWLEGALRAPERLAFAWVVLLAFMRLSTKPALFPHPLTVSEATSQVRSWLDRAATVVLDPTSRHLDVLAGLLREAGAGGNLVNDAHLAALAIEHDATLVSFDHDFARFEGLRLVQPG